MRVDLGVEPIAQPFGVALTGRVESRRADGRVRWRYHRFRDGPPSGSRDHVSNSRHVKPRHADFPPGLHQGTWSTRSRRRNEANHVHQPQLTVEATLRQGAISLAPPPLVAMRPKASNHPTGEMLEEPTPMNLAVVPTPAANNRVDLGHELTRRAGRFPARVLADFWSMKRWMEG